MKIMIVMEGFFPGGKYGGPPVSVNNFCSLYKDAACYVVCKNHDKGEEQQYSNITTDWNRRPNCHVKYLDDSSFKMNDFRHIVDEINPDILYLQSMFEVGVIPCLILAKQRNIEVLLAPRGELCAGAFKKKYKKLPYIAALRWMGLIRNVHFQSTSDEETESIRKWLGVSTSRIHFLANIPSIPLEDYDYQKKQTGTVKIIFLSRIHKKKNLLFALQCLKHVSAERVYFDIYGPIEDKLYWENCEQEMQTMPENVKLNYCGLASYDKVHETFAKYDLFFFPTLSENFGHVIAEALLVGCPVLISDQTPFSAVEDNNAGWAVSLDNAEKYIAVMNQIALFNESEMRNLRISAKKYIKEKISIDQLAKEYRNVFQSICGNGDSKK